MDVYKNYGVAGNILTIVINKMTGFIRNAKKLELFTNLINKCNSLKQ